MSESDRLLDEITMENWRELLPIIEDALEEERNEKGRQVISYCIEHAKLLSTANELLDTFLATFANFVWHGSRMYADKDYVFELDFQQAIVDEYNSGKMAGRFFRQLGNAYKAVIIAAQTHLYLLTGEQSEQERTAV